MKRTVRISTCVILILIFTAAAISVTMVLALDSFNEKLGDANKRIEINKVLDEIDSRLRPKYLYEIDEQKLTEGINRGYVIGIGDNIFKPDGDITRAEFCTIFCRIKGFTKTVNSDFADIEGHWAKDCIDAIFEHGCITGYDENGIMYFKPDEKIERSEAVAIINRIEERPKSFTGTKTFLDVTTEHWAYIEIMNAANGYYQ